MGGSLRGPPTPLSLSGGRGARGPDESQHLHSEPKGLPHSGDLSYFGGIKCQVSESSAARVKTSSVPSPHGSRAQGAKGEGVLLLRGPTPGHS